MRYAYLLHEEMLAHILSLFNTWLHSYVKIQMTTLIPILTFIGENILLHYLQKQKKSIYNNKEGYTSIRYYH